jgi:hypothetical protein
MACCEIRHSPFSQLENEILSQEPGRLMRRFDAAIWLQATGRFFDLASLNNSTTYHDPSRLVLAKQLGRRSPARLILEINVSELLPAVVAHDKAGIQFLDGPGRPEAADAEAITSYCQRAKKGPSSEPPGPG